MKPFYVFDAYGTLFDVASPVRRHAEAIGPAAERLAELWRLKQLEYTWVRSMSDTYQDFEVLTEAALDYSMASLGLSDAALRGKLLEAYQAPDCYEEVPAALAALNASGAKIAILSNGTPAMLDAAVTAAEIGHHMHAILSVELGARVQDQSGSLPPRHTLFRLRAKRGLVPVLQSLGHRRRRRLRLSHRLDQPPPRPAGISGPRTRPGDQRFVEALSF